MEGNWQDQFNNKKKKTSKKPSYVPANDLGFKATLHADIIDPRNLKRIPARNKKKYTAKSTKQHFMTRLRMVVDVRDMPEDSPHHLFKVNKKSDWTFVKKVFYRSREKIFCSICLQQKIVAPQITFCGHIYCFHCILMHFKKSTNCFSCPVCKELTDRQELKTCEINYDVELHQSDEITFKLKIRQGHYIYESQTLRQDIKSTHIMRMRTPGLIPIFQRELQQLKEQISHTLETQRNHIYLVEAIKIAEQKLNKIEMSLKKGNTHVDLRQNEIMDNNVIYRFLTKEESERMNSFYQESSDSLIFIHTLSRNYMNQITQKLHSFSSIIFYRQELDFREEGEYRDISLFDLGLQTDAVIIDILQFVGEKQNERYKQEVEEYRKKKLNAERKQEVELQRLNLEYEEDQKYLRKLKEQQESQYYFDVKLPPTLDPSDINEHSFPSLIGSKDQDQDLDDNENLEVLGLKKTQTSTNKPQKFDLNKETDSFPELDQIKSIKSEGMKPIKQNKKKKKQKFVDMTSLIMFNRDEYDYE